MVIDMTGGHDLLEEEIISSTDLRLLVEGMTADVDDMVCDWFDPDCYKQAVSWLVWSCGCKFKYCVYHKDDTLNAVKSSARMVCRHHPVETVVTLYRIEPIR